MLEYGDMLFREIKTIKSITSLKNTSYYMSFYIWLLEQELLLIRQLDTRRKNYIVISANGKNALRFIFVTDNGGNHKDEIVTVIEKTLTDRQFTNFMRGN